MKRTITKSCDFDKVGEGQSYTERLKSEGATLYNKVSDFSFDRAEEGQSGTERLKSERAILYNKVSDCDKDKDGGKRRIHLSRYESPCGELLLGSIGEELCLCDWNDMPCVERNKRRLVRLLHAEFTAEPSEVIQRTKQQLNEYFAGERSAFDIPLHPVGTDFQQRVWRALSEIPFGQTRSYKDIALRVGNLKGIRAVAQAIGANGISILIPCHRVIGSNHSLTGFAGGLQAKRTLLEIENPVQPLWGYPG